MAFHDNLRTLRLARGLTQPALAEKADIEQSYLSKLENGRSRPSDDVLARLAQALETAPETLLGNGDEHDLHHAWFWRASKAAAIIVILFVGFIIGRATAIYPLSTKQLLAGEMPAEDLTQQFMLMAPTGINVIDISRSGDGNKTNISGKTTSAVLVGDYMNAIRKRYGGDFQEVMISPAAPDGSSHFSILYITKCQPLNLRLKQ
ncbi:MAG: helix-turn-helix transcriptional regulator [Gammaproteobacteria bacterium]